MPPSLKRKFRLSGVAIVLALLSGCNDSLPRQSSFNNGTLPAPLTVAETIKANAGDSVCGSGGIRLVYGLDHNNDGRVGPYESLGTEYVCNPGSDKESGPRVVTTGDGIPAEDRERILRALNRS